MPLFLLTYWKWIAIGGLILICAISVGVMKVQLKHCRADLAQSQAQVAILASEIEKQNKAVEDLGKATLEAQKRTIEALKKVRLIQAQAQTKINALQAIPVRNSPTCAQSVEDIDRLLGAAR